MIINLPKDLDGHTTHRYGPNSFKLHRRAAGANMSGEAAGSARRGLTQQPGSRRLAARRAWKWGRPESPLAAG
jgi:hypothetical protein